MSYPDFLKLNRVVLKRTLHQMVTEDLGDGDTTALLTPNRIVRAEIIANSAGVVSGVYELNTLFGLYDITVLKYIKDGAALKKGKRIFLIKGDSHNLLLIERTALNILSRMSGITTSTCKYVALAKRINPKVRVAATRKTTPLFRYFEKKAVVAGGAASHRMGLFDMALIKDNHLKPFKSVGDAVRKMKNTKFESEIEVTSLKEATEAVEAGAKIVMLDNLLPNQIKKVIKELQDAGLRDKVTLEASGGITLKNIEKYARTGVDVISVGHLTYSVPIIDFSLRVL